MDSEERRQYNAVYYSLHRERILSYLCEKVQCQFCQRTVIKNNLLKHQKSDICKRTRERILEIDEFLKKKHELSHINHPTEAL